MLGLSQIEETNLWLKESDVRIAIVHHPLESPAWFKSWDWKAHPRLTEVDFLLNGHVHDPDVRPLFDERGGVRRLNVTAGAMYQFEEAEARQDLWTGFHCVIVNLTKAQIGVISWIYSSEAGKWTEDSRRGSQGLALTGLSEGRLSERVERWSAQVGSKASESKRGS